MPTAIDRCLPIILFDRSEWLWWNELNKLVLDSSRRGVDVSHKRLMNVSSSSSLYATGVAGELRNERRTTILSVLLFLHRVLFAAGSDNSSDSISFRSAEAISSCHHCSHSLAFGGKPQCSTIPILVCDIIHSPSPYPECLNDQVKL